MRRAGIEPHIDRIGEFAITRLVDAKILAPCGEPRFYAALRDFRRRALVTLRARRLAAIARSEASCWPGLWTESGHRRSHSPHGIPGGERSYYLYEYFPVSQSFLNHAWPSRLENRCTDHWAWCIPARPGRHCSLECP